MDKQLTRISSKILICHNNTKVGKNPQQYTKVYLEAELKYCKTQVELHLAHLTPTLF